MNILVRYFMNIYNFFFLYKSYFFIIFFIILILIIIILFTLCCYILYKFFHIKFKKIYLDNYHGDSKKILLKYGNKRIKNVYLIKEKLYHGYYIKIINNFLKYFLNKNYDLGNYCHTSFIFDIDLGNNIIKKIKLNKNFYLNITENFSIYNYQEMKCNKIKNKKYTLNYILNKTKKNINSKKFFNWNLTYNCQFFTKKILSSMKLLNSNNLKFVEYLNVYNLIKKVKCEDKMCIYIHNILLNILVFIYKLFF